MELPKNVVAAGDRLTEKYRAELEGSQAKIIAEAEQWQVVVQAVVVGAGVESVERSSAEILVFMNRTIGEPGREPLYDGYWLRVTMRRVDNKWLIDFTAAI